MVMERYQISEERAFQFLVRVSSTSNIKLRDIAQELIDTANTKYSPRAARHLNDTPEGTEPAR